MPSGHDGPEGEMEIMKKTWKAPTLIAVLLLGALCLAVPALAQEAGQEASQDSDAAAAAPSTQDTVEDVIVVTASRSEQRLQEVPAAMTVITGVELEQIPADDYGDVLRTVPGLNVAQMSARDIQITGRSATNSLAASQLVLLDGRTVYLDFFGFVMWDLLPINPREIKQIEVVRGPGSAVWGANAMTGVVNLITKTPSEMVGTDVMVGGGELSTLFASISHARASEKVGVKVSASYYEQDPFDRPTGVIPGTTTLYPPFENQGTKQPKVDVRVDYNPDESTSWTFGGGYAGTDGIIHSGIGPFDIDSGTNMSYARASWARGAARVGFFANLLDGQASNLLTVGPTGQPLLLSFESQTYNLDASNVSVLGDHHIFTYGANARQNNFDLSIAPAGDERQEYGVFLQDEILIGDKVRWLIGGRWDDIDPIGSVFSPRSSLLISPSPNHTFRLSYNRAFKAPSLIQNFLDITIVNAACLIPGVPADPTLCRTPLGSALLVFPSAAVGNPGLQEERLDAFEVGYVGNFGSRTTVTVSVYRNETQDSQDFFNRDFYTTASPPPGWPPPGVVPPGVPPQFIPVPPNTFPSAFSYRNIGEIVDQGVEFSINQHPTVEWSWYFNYSWQDKPDVTGIPEDEVNIPPEHRANFGLGYNGQRFFANGNVNYVDEAFWTDVLDSRFHGPTDSYTQVNLSLGVRLLNDKVTFSVIGNNIFDEDVQQHIFGDIISRKVIAQVLFSF